LKFALADPVLCVGVKRDPRCTEGQRSAGRQPWRGSSPLLTNARSPRSWSRSAACRLGRNRARWAKCHLGAELVRAGRTGTLRARSYHRLADVYPGVDVTGDLVAADRSADSRHRSGKQHSCPWTTVTGAGLTDEAAAAVVSTGTVTTIGIRYRRVRPVRKAVSDLRQRGVGGTSWRSEGGASERQ